MLHDLSLTSQWIINEAKKRGIIVKRIGRRHLYLIDGQREHLVIGKKVPASFNPPKTRSLVDDKAKTSQLLRKKGFLAPESRVFYRQDVEKAWSYARPKAPVVVKPPSSKKGALVFLKITEKEPFVDSFKKVASEHRKVLVESYVEGEEYRFTFIQDSIVAIAKREPAQIIGDGSSTILELVKRKNQERERRSIPSEMGIVVDEAILYEQGYRQESIPPQGAKVYLSQKANISAGGEAYDMTDSIEEEIKERINQAALAITGLQVAGIDVLVREGEPLILEINANPGFITHHFPYEGPSRNVAAALIEAMFPGAKRPSLFQGIKERAKWALILYARHGVLKIKQAIKDLGGERGEDVKNAMQRAYSIVKRQREKRRVFRDLCKTMGLNQVKGDELEALLQYAQSYQRERRHLEASLCFDTILRNDPFHLEALEGRAALAYDQGYWKESWKYYERAQRAVDALPSSREREELWLSAQKKILISLLNVKEYSLVRQERGRLFERLNGDKDIKTLLQSWGYREDIEYSATFFIKGLSSYYTALHQVEGEGLSFIEKCCKKESQEIDVYKTIEKSQVSAKSSLMRAPDCLGFYEGPTYTKIFLELIEERPIKEVPCKRIDFFKLGEALGEISFYLTDNSLKDPLPLYPLRDYQGEKALEVFSSYPKKEAHSSVDLLYDFYAKFDPVLSYWEKIPKVFSHNDTGANNVFMDTKTGRFIFIDWERAAYNAAGSDIGSILRWKAYKEAKMKGLAQEIEDTMVDGYLFSLSKLGSCSIAREEVILAYHFHFINGKLKTAINRGNYPLFRHIAERSQWILELLGL